jgi:hypothetical protein
MAAMPGATIFHSTAWARALVETYEYVPSYLVAGTPGEIHGVLPLMEVNSWLTGRRGVGLPFTDECEPLCGNQETFTTLFHSALELGRTRKWKYVECRGGRRFLAGKPSSLDHYSHELKLAAVADEVFAGLDGAVRRAIRKAGKAGVEVEVSQDLAAVKIFYQLQTKTRRRHGLPPQPFTWFGNLYRHILAQNMGIVVVARKGHTPVSAAMYFYLGNKAVYKYGASDARYQDLRGNNLVMWEAIKWCGRRGLQHMSLGRTSLDQAGLRKFKLGWGTQEERITYFKYDLQQEQFIVERDKTTGWHNRIFRLAPGFISQAAGRLLYRHWA